MKIFQLFLLLCITTSISAQDTIAIKAQKNITLMPAILSFETGKGTSDTLSAFLYNAKDEPYNFKVYLADWERDTIGHHVFYKPGTYHHSCAQWITLNTNYVVLAPGEKKEIKVAITVPDDVNAVKTMKWAMLLFELVQENQKNNKTGISSVQRLGAHIYQTPPNPEFAKKLAITDMTEQSDRKYRVAVGNIGDLQVYCKTKLELKPAKGATIKLPETEAPMFPDQLRYFDFNLPAGIPPGKYKAIATVYADYDEKSAETLERTVEIK